MPHPPLLLISCSLLPQSIPPPGKAYIISRYHCCLCPPLDGNILGGIPPPPNAKPNAITPFLLFARADTTLPASSNSHHTFSLCCLRCHLPTPCRWLVVVCWADGVGHCQCPHYLLIILLPSSHSPPLFVECCFHCLRPCNHHCHCPCHC